MNVSETYSSKDKQRLAFIALMLGFVAIMLVWRAIDLHVVSQAFLKLPAGSIGTC